MASMSHICAVGSKEEIEDMRSKRVNHQGSFSAGGP
ncbi:hypothetical protein A2U01_0097358, partial [Trifolium medium]|nr:hypothetical protein [Trifolium medium]